MSDIVVFIDQPGDSLGKAHRELLTFAHRAGTPVAVVVGVVPAGVLAELGSYGVVQVFSSEQAELTNYSVVPKAEFLATIAVKVGTRAVLTGNSSEQKDIAARVAVSLAAGVISDAVGLDEQLVAEKSVLAGSYSVRAKTTSPVSVIALKSNSTEPEVSPNPQQAVLESVTVDFSTAAWGSKVLERTDRPANGRPELSDARIVVAGGRGVDGDFGPVEALADALGAAVGASRAATDAGWIDHAAQVGQTGKTVSPQLYISVGISGAIQQKAGMQTAKLIVAVNKDADSPVFEIADLGIVGDLFKVLPQAVEEINRRRQ
ncbi:electron transfer flavoprotein alpha-subunit [Renibacterium salmoninarum ATCC 33209]|uniref:Electron transfer flavoprotein alpha-subunit n=1 Tax=Renibacterium salmoninarum (strain ATCC 33209 / DSM 20767 / JCM 11484 / NBRC 15589 / NCIMB 2235) TaxID=288705 RepID=A9WPQ4_RENSM|nr:electron transfer flavoprotein subunit alpha/FixB family protein [Renibacterium salmoninarum]ABY23012.1 electron transfer flavoprotein alpha-subunit [Renibacterium salmoninarum ATCC 33209]